MWDECDAICCLLVGRQIRLSLFVLEKYLFIRSKNAMSWRVVGPVDWGHQPTKKRSCHQLIKG